MRAFGSVPEVRLRMQVAHPVPLVPRSAISAVRGVPLNPLDRPSPAVASRLDSGPRSVQMSGLGKNERRWIDSALRPPAKRARSRRAANASLQQLRLR
jgi:hypothetical protein